MTILWLGPERKRLIEFVEAGGDTVIRREDRLSGDDPEVRRCDFLISYGYRYILKDDVLSHFGEKAINLHISYLPYNRGADPNLWSFLEDTPKGVTIHCMDVGLDTGDILAQRRVEMSDADTLRTSYEKLARAIEELFVEKWPEIREGALEAKPQPNGGTAHKLKDKKPYEHLLDQGWDTPVRKLVGKAGQQTRS